LVVPKDAMLCRFVSINDEGNVLGLDNKQSIKYSYGSMLNLRVQLVYGFAIGFIMNQTIYHYDVLKAKNLEKIIKNK
jgi:hypothetical protein